MLKMFFRFQGSFVSVCGVLQCCAGRRQVGFSGTVVLWNDLRIGEDYYESVWGRID